MAAEETDGTTKDKATREAEAQKEVLRQAATGALADLTPWKGRATDDLVSLPASFIRELLCLGLPKPGKKSERTRLPFGLWIKEARIEGTLDLRDAIGVDGQGCAALVLEDCQLVADEGMVDHGGFKEPRPSIDARHATLLRLSLRRCQVGFLELSDARSVATSNSAS